MIIKLDSNKIDIDLLLYDVILDSYIDIDSFEIEASPYDEKIFYKVIAFNKYFELNREAQVTVSGSFDKEKILDYINELKCCGFSSLDKTVDNDPESISVTLSNKFNNLKEIADLWNAYKEQSLGDRLSKDWNSILMRCPKTAEALRDYCKIHDSSLLNLPEGYLDNIDDLTISGESCEVLKGKLDFDWVDAKNQKTVFDELVAFIESRITFKELSFVSNYIVELKIKNVQ